MEIGKYIWVRLIWTPRNGNGQKGGWVKERYGVGDLLSSTFIYSTVLGRLKSLGYRPSSHMCGKTFPYFEVGMIWALASVAARLVLWSW